MAENEYTKKNRNKGIPSQIIFDAGLNVFALMLLVESYTDLPNPEPISFPYRGVNISLSLCEEKNEHQERQIITCDNCGAVIHEEYGGCLFCSGGALDESW